MDLVGSPVGFDVVAGDTLTRGGTRLSRAVSFASAGTDVRTPVEH